MNETPDHLDLTAAIVCAFVSHNAVPVAELPALIASTHAALTGLGVVPEAPLAAPREPAVPVKKSVGHDTIICLDCGEGFRSLKRHIRTAHGQAPEAYRAAWGLGPEYPMVAPEYRAKRSALARQFGLGRKPAAMVM